MREKKLYLYLRDEEYGKKLLKYLTSRHHPKLRVELMTDREIFWESRGNRKEQNRKLSERMTLATEMNAPTADTRESTGEFWLTDDGERAASDRGDGETLILLDEKGNTVAPYRISYCQKSKYLYRELLTVLQLFENAETGEAGAPQAGVYTVFGFGASAGCFAGSLLSQVLGKYGECLLVYLTEFSESYDEADANGESEYAKYGHGTEEGSSTYRQGLGELFFRLDRRNYSDVVRGLAMDYGSAKRLPPVKHFRDLYDIGEGELSEFISRVYSECGFRYVVVVADCMGVVLSCMPNSTGIFLVAEDTAADRKNRDVFTKYIAVEKGEYISDGITHIVLPEKWCEWRRKIQFINPREWLGNEDIKRFSEGMIKNMDG